MGQPKLNLLSLEVDGNERSTIVATVYFSAGDVRFPAVPLKFFIGNRPDLVKLCDDLRAQALAGVNGMLGIENLGPDQISPPSQFLPSEE